MLAEFSRRKGIDFPLLADPESQLLSQLGLVNNEADGIGKGVAHPGVLVLNSEGRLKEKFFEESYRDRLTANTLLLELFPELTSTEVAKVSEGGLTVRLGQTDQELIMGSQATLLVELEIPEGSHLYGPSAQGYVPVGLRPENNEWVTFDEVRFPPAQEQYLEAIDETVPVYSKKLRLEVPLSVARPAANLKTAKTVKLQATLEYQMCTETTCLLPTTQKVEWTITLEPLDRQRSPEEIQH